MLENLSWTDANEILGPDSVVLIPVGSTEQHGPHLPLGTDFLIAAHLARLAAAAAGAVCTPVIPVGVSAHHRHFTGTLTVTPDAFRSFMRDLALSVLGQGVSRVVFVNGHGGNASALQEVCRDVRHDGLLAVVWQWWTTDLVRDLTDELFASRGSHAAAAETSVIWAIDDSLVGTDRLEEAAAGASEVFGRSVHGAQLPLDTLDFSESGATMDPREASAQAGERLLVASISELIQLVHWLETVPDDLRGPWMGRPPEV